MTTLPAIRSGLPATSPAFMLARFSEACRRHGLDPRAFEVVVDYLPDCAQYELKARRLA